MCPIFIYRGVRRFMGCNSKSYVFCAESNRAGQGTKCIRTGFAASLRNRENHLFGGLPGNFFVGIGENKKMVVSSIKMM